MMYTGADLPANPWFYKLALSGRVVNLLARSFLFVCRMKSCGPEISGRNAIRAKNVISRAFFAH